MIRCQVSQTLATYVVEDHVLSAASVTHLPPIRIDRAIGNVRIVFVCENVRRQDLATLAELIEQGSEFSIQGERNRRFGLLLDDI